MHMNVLRDLDNQWRQGLHQRKYIENKANKRNYTMINLKEIKESYRKEKVIAVSHMALL